MTDYPKEHRLAFIHDEIEELALRWLNLMQHQNPTIVLEQEVQDIFIMMQEYYRINGGNSI